MKAQWQKTKFSRKPHPIPNITAISKPVCEVMAIFVYQDGRQPPSWILLNRK